MGLPVLNLNNKYRAIQSSSEGTIYFQNGHLFAEGGQLLGQAPPWGPDLFTKDGHAIDSHEVALAYAKEHAAIEVLDGPPKEQIRPSAKPKYNQNVEEAADPFSVDDVFGAETDEVSPLIENDLLPESKPKRGRPTKHR